MKRGELNTLHDEVKELLESDPRLRESDNKLWARIINNRIGSVQVTEITAYQLLCMVANNELPNWDTLTRARRVIQEDYPELRGAKWKERHEFQEEVITELGYKIDLR